MIFSDDEITEITGIQEIKEQTNEKKIIIIDKMEEVINPCFIIVIDYMIKFINNISFLLNFINNCDESIIFTFF